MTWIDNGLIGNNYGWNLHHKYKEPYTPYITDPVISIDWDWSKVFVAYQKKEEPMAKFYASPYPSITPTYGPFDSQEKATAKAEEMAKANPGKEYVVLQALTKSTTASVIMVSV